MALIKDYDELLNLKTKYYEDIKLRFESDENELIS